MGKRRTSEVHLRLSEDENARLVRMSDRCGLQRTDYIRRLICGVVPRASPPLDYNDLISTIKEIGTGLADVAEVARITGQIDAGNYAELVEELFATVSRIDRQFAGEDPIDLKEALRYGPD